MLRRLPQHCRRVCWDSDKAVLWFRSGGWHRSLGDCPADPADPTCSWQRISTPILGWTQGPCPTRPDLTGNVQKNDFLLGSGRKVIFRSFRGKNRTRAALQAPVLQLRVQVQSWGTGHRARCLGHTSAVTMRRERETGKVPRMGRNQREAEIQAVGTVPWGHRAARAQHQLSWCSLVPEASTAFPAPFQASSQHCKGLHQG